MENNEFKGLWVPKEIWDLKDLGWSEKLFLAEINVLEKENKCYANNSHFSELFNITKVSVSRIINKLISKKYLISEVNIKGKTKHIERRILRINWEFLINQNDNTPKQNCISPLNNSDNKPLTQMLKREYNIDNNIENKYIYAQNRPQCETKNPNKKNNYADLFERFYKIYPKKKGRHKAQRWFKTHKPSPELVDKMIDAVKLQKQTLSWRKQNGAFIPYPTSWLNSGGWDNEISPDEIVDTSDSSISRFLAIELYESLSHKHFEHTKELEKLIQSWALVIEEYLSVCRVKEREDKVFHAIDQVRRSDKWRGTVTDAESLIHNIDFIRA